MKDSLKEKLALDRTKWDKDGKLEKLRKNRIKKSIKKMQRRWDLNFLMQVGECVDYYDECETCGAVDGEACKDANGINCYLRMHPTQRMNMPDPTLPTNTTTPNQALSQSDLLDAAIEVERRLREDTKTIADLIRRYGGKAEKEAWKRAIYGSAIRLQLFTSNAEVSRGVRHERS